MKSLAHWCIALLVVTSSALANDNDKVSTLAFDDLTLHTFHGVSNSHIIETANELHLIDAQMKLSDAQTLKAYIATLKKPLKQVILSHNHPDHWFGATVFEKDSIITTSKGVITDLEQGGARYLGILKKRLKDDMPTEVIKPQTALELGKHTWDGLDILVEEYTEHESHHSLVIKLPKHGVMIGQDLFYNEMFLVASDRQRNQRWIEILENFQKSDAKNYPTILVGHGKNSDPSVFQQDIDYLRFLEKTLAKGLSKEETQKIMIAQYPNKGGKGMLGISMRNLFSEGH